MNATSIYRTLRSRFALLENSPANILIVDWTPCLQMKNILLSVVFCLAEFVKGVAQFLAYITSKGGNYKKVQVIGHGEGVQLGAVLYYFGLNFGRLTGLGPAKILGLNLLTSQCGDFVDVIHTDDVLGIWEPTGSADFYPNGGKNQTLCFGSVDETNVACNEEMAVLYYTHALKKPKLFPARKCPSVEGAQTNTNCKKSKVFMGVLANSGMNGVYYVNANNWLPTTEDETTSEAARNRP